MLAPRIPNEFHLSKTVNASSFIPFYEHKSRPSDCFFYFENDFENELTGFGCNGFKLLVIQISIKSICSLLLRRVYDI